MAHTSCELLCMRHLLKELCFEVKLPMSMYCDNQAAIHIALKMIFHLRSKHIEVNCHLIQEQVEKGIIATPFVSTRAHLADMFTKFLFKSRLESLCNKLGLYDICTL